MFVNSQDIPKLEEKLVSLSEVDEQAVDQAIRSFEPKDLPEFSLGDKLKQIRDTFHAKDYEGIESNLKRDGSDWAKAQLATLSKMSPTSLKVTHRQLMNGSQMSFSKIFTMEYRLTQRFVNDKDFHEGCRAILIDKDRNPKWDPARLEDVTEKTLDHYFEPLPHNEDLRILNSAPKL
ncbi:unnamed protein product [Caenorhabditis auriculariae]|uniref:3-hydroxyisobutyryl-CoA hydrolase, mitochondrial n=1 Tax=Caenorhabditis auriculariae TaxID=2777116 RepID=A0A8S1GWV9_9PELO|nr:unnamed protein product [Caenorhabditis auriculariae]